MEAVEFQEQTFLLNAFPCSLIPIFCVIKHGRSGSNERCWSGSGVEPITGEIEALQCEENLRPWKGEGQPCSKSRKAEVGELAKQSGNDSSARQLVLELRRGTAVCQKPIPCYHKAGYIHKAVDITCSIKQSSHRNST